MKTILKISVIGLAMLTAVGFYAFNSAAMMGGGHGGGSGHGSGSSSGMGAGTFGGGHHDTQQMDRHMEGYGNQGMEQGAHQGWMEDRVHQYMRDRTSESYHMGDWQDQGAYFSTEIQRPDGSVMEHLGIDKRTGQIRRLPQN